MNGSSDTSSFIISKRFKFLHFFFSCTLDYWGGLCLLHPEKYSRSEEAHSHNRGF